VSWKLSRTVLRGGTNRNVGPLLDQKTGKAKQPYCFEVNEGELFVFAGIWDRWKDPSGNALPLFLGTDAETRMDVGREQLSRLTRKLVRE
jgi:hypothetical protein